MSPHFLTVRPFVSVCLLTPSLSLLVLPCARGIIVCLVHFPELRKEFVGAFHVYAVVPFANHLVGVETNTASGFGV